MDIITFDVGGSRAELHLSHLTGRYWLVVDGREYVLASLWDPSTYFSLTTTRKWTVSHGRHEIEIEKRRAPVYGGFTPVTVYVDGNLVPDTSAQTPPPPREAPRRWAGW
jgi:hypothetical protein